MKTKLLFFLPAPLIALTAFVKFDTGHYTEPPPVVSLNNSFIFGAMNDEWDYGSVRFKFSIPLAKLTKNIDIIEAPR